MVLAISSHVRPTKGYPTKVFFRLCVEKSRIWWSIRKVELYACALVYRNVQKKEKTERVTVLHTLTLLHGPRIRSDGQCGLALYLPLCCLVFAPVLAKTFASDLQSLTQIRISHCHTPLATLANSTGDVLKCSKCATSVSCADIFTLAPRAFPTQHLPLFLPSLFNSILCICFNKESTLRLY